MERSFTDRRAKTVPRATQREHVSDGPTCAHGPPRVHFLAIRYFEGDVPRGGLWMCQHDGPRARSRRPFSWQPGLDGSHVSQKNWKQYGWLQFSEDRSFSYSMVFTYSQNVYVICSLLCCICFCFFGLRGRIEHREHMTRGFLYGRLHLLQRDCNNLEENSSRKKKM